MTDADPRNAAARKFDDAVGYHRRGDLEQAASIYDEILRIVPEHFDALHLLGVTAHQRGDHARAIELIGRAVKIEPAAYPAFNHLGLAQQALGRLDDARSSYEAAVALEPDFVDAQSNLAIVLGAQDELDAAVIHFECALALRPEFAEAHSNLGNVLQGQGKLPEAIVSYQRALALKPNFFEAQFNLAKAYELQGHAAQALAGYRQAILLKPDLAEAHLCAGTILHAQGSLDQALACFDQALALNPRLGEAQWSRAMALLALVYEKDDSQDESRRAFADALAKLDAWFDDERAKDGFKAVGTQQPFYLAYHERNNRELLSRYGDLCARLMAKWQSAQGLSPPAGVTGAEASRPLRVGIVSAHFHDHPVWNAIVKGWCANLDRRRFALHLFHTGSTHDAETLTAQRLGAMFVSGKRSLRRWVDLILAERLDVIIYPEIGMDQMTVKLASLRLAPAQVATWGHPDTTGLPTIDYYLSAEAFEPATPQENYREQLVALPNLGCCYSKLTVVATTVDLLAMGIDISRPILVCAGTPFKYAPRHDWVYVEIARRIERCQLVFFRYSQEQLSALLQRRLEVAFEKAGMDFRSYGVFVPWLPRTAFYGMLKQADVYLDTIGFSGFNTAMQAVECGLPIVTHAGSFMRGRLASGILERLDLGELIAPDEESYVRSAVKLATDDIYRQRVRTRIEVGRDTLFEDHAPIRALELFLDSIAKA